MEISKLSVNTIRTLSMDTVEEAQSGHLGMPLGSAPMAYILWKYFLNINPKNPKWFNRDRFILSAGHGSMLLYSLLHLSGYDLTIQDLKDFRRIYSKTPGHPEVDYIPGVEVTTGPLGQGLANAVGIALAERHLAARFNKEDFSVIDHYTYVLCGDGDLMEGITSEASSLAGHLQLDRLIVLYDSNDNSLDGATNLSFTENIEGRFSSYGWQYLKVEDGNDLSAIKEAMAAAKNEKNRPSIIEVKTVIGYGVKSVQGTSDAHSDPVGRAEINKAKEFYKWPYKEEFYVPDAVYNDFETIRNNGEKKEKEWELLFQKYKRHYPEKAQELQHIMEGGDFKTDIQLPTYEPDKYISTRVASSDALNIVAENLPNIIGGAADLSTSTRTSLNAYGKLYAQNCKGRNIYFGVREFAMAAIANGLALHNLRPFVSTYLVFSDYMKAGIRLSALMGLPVIYIFTHDSIAVGKDGPTHQPIEQINSLREIPNVSVIRPADANETRDAWEVIINENQRPTILILSRQDLPVLTYSWKKTKVAKGAYVISYADQEPEGLLIASGSEVCLALKAKEKLAKENIHVNVVSMPSWNLFEEQSSEYKEKVLPKELGNRLVIEMGSKGGWREYEGDKGVIMSIEMFGVSGSEEDVLREYGYTVENIVAEYKNHFC